jgi:hypothetical protein
MTPQLLTVPSPLRRLLTALVGAALILLASALTPSLLAQGISLNAGFNPATTVLGEPVEFNVIISGTNRNQGNPPLPSADGIQFRYVGRHRGRTHRRANRRNHLSNTQSDTPRSGAG